MFDLEQLHYIACDVIIFTKFDLRQLIRASVIAFWCWYVMSCYNLDLWPVNLELLQ